MNKLKIVFLLLVTFTINCAQDTTPPSIPQNVKSINYELHSDIVWNSNSESDLSGYKIYKKAGDTYTLQKLQPKEKNYFSVYVGNGSNYIYKVSAIDQSGNESQLSGELSLSSKQMGDNDFLDMVQRAVFRYFWNYADPVSGLMRERYHPNNGDRTATIGGSGFGIMAIPVGVERGFISREEGAERILKIADFLLNKADRFHGVYPHWINGSTGKVIPFSTKDDGGDLVESSFLIQGLLTVRAYFDNGTEEEVSLRDKITQIWDEVEWSWYKQVGQNWLTWHWSPQNQFSMNMALKGWNETFMPYLLAAARYKMSVNSNFGIHPYYISSGWGGNTNNFYKERTVNGFPLILGSGYGGPLFFTHYSFLGFDPRNIKHQVNSNWINYFTHNKNQSLANHSFSVINPNNRVGYSNEIWGLTASYSIPGQGYLAHEPGNDNGTIAPTAALSSMPYTPTESIAALKAFYRNYAFDTNGNEKLWGEYGFKDAFNLTYKSVNVSGQWFSDGWLAIDQGPIIVMIENYRSQLLWNNFMSVPEIKMALDAIGFVPDSTTSVNENNLELPTTIKLEQNYPNPFNPTTTISYAIPFEGNVKLEIYNSLGEIVNILQDSYQDAGNHSIAWTGKDSNGNSLSSGIYFYRLISNDFVQVKKMTLIK
ncbi:MAG: T9SS type A sorting domain-containing protein [Melioribacteraceae bacterium]|nr:T9SS type A sorting domain-containing protein [Melioribacteraceae bacterium]